MRDRYGPWEVRGTLGAGGMGRVLRAVDPESGRQVALKVARIGDEARRALAREVAALRRCEHPGIVRILGHGTEGDETWVATELVEGRSLRDQVHRSHPDAATSAETFVIEDATGEVVSAETRVAWTRDALAEALAPVRDLCEALSWLHGEGLVHGDVKPENLMLRADGSAVLVDFGLVHAAEASGRSTLQLPRRVLVGTSGYLSPEMCLGRPVDGRADLYAVGCLIHELLTGRPPYGHGRGAAQAHVSAPLPDLSQLPGIPLDLALLVARLLEKEPDRRVPFARDVVDWLEAFGVRPSPWSVPPAPIVLHRPALAGRDAELAALAGSRVAVVSGPAGVGKTRLLEAAAREVEGPMVVATTLPALVHELLELADEEQRETWFGDDAPVLASVSARAAAALGDARLVPEGALVAAVHAVLGRAAPLRVVLDDVGPATAGLAARLVRQTPPGVAVWLGCSDHALAERLEGLGARRVALSPLGEADERALLRQVLSDPDVPEEILDAVHRRVDGNPRLAWELLGDWVRAGHLRRLDGRWVVRERDRLRELPAPRDLADLVRARLDALSSELREVVGAFAIGGEPACTDAELALALAAGVLEARGDEVALALPGLGAQAIEGLSARRAAAAHTTALAHAPPMERARHLLVLGRSSEARALLLELADQAYAASRWPDVVEAATLARAGATPEEEERIRVWLGRASLVRGRYQETLDLLGDRFDHEAPVDLVAVLRGWAGSRLPGHDADAIAWLRGAIGRCDDPALRSLLAVAFGGALVTRDEGTEAIRVYRDALAFLTARGAPSDEVTRIRVALAEVHLVREEPDDLRAQLEQVGEVPPELPLRRGTVERLFANLAAMEGDHAEALRRARAAATWDRRAGSVPNEVQSLTVVATTLRDRGRFAEAADVIRQIRALAEEIDVPRFRAHARFLEVRNRVDAGDADALEAVLGSLDDIRRTGFVRPLSVLHLVAARLLRRAGRWEEMEAQLAASEALLGGPHASQRWHIEVERALLDLHRGAPSALDRARSALARVEELARPDSQDLGVRDELSAALAEPRLVPRLPP
ncbi:MAG: protein kinase [Alphaproteobacteria bacterium]|nr:protein kinase [Alphaproteobacteria bacterium]